MRCDLTWLTSRYTCIFGQGCHGIYATSPTPAAARWARTSPTRTTRSGWRSSSTSSTETLWQHQPARPRCASEDWIETDDEGERKTRTLEVDGQRGVHLPQPHRLPRRGAGCALHALALSRAATRSRPSRTCAGSCRSGAPSGRSSGRTGRRTRRSRSASTTAAAGAPGGHDLDWYCSGNTEAHVAVEPLYVTNEPELVELMGRAAYDELVRALRGPPASRSALALHPADPR